MLVLPVMTFFQSFPVLLASFPDPRGFAETGASPLKLAVFDHHPAQRGTLPFMLTR
jgi:hypothetical protein